MDVLASKWLLQDETLPDLLSQTTCEGPEWSDLNIGVQLLSVLGASGMDSAVAVLRMLVRLTEPPHGLQRNVVYLSLENLVLASGSTEFEPIWQFVETNEEFLCYKLDGLKPPGSTLLRTINALEALARSSQNQSVAAKIAAFSEKVFGVRERFPHKTAVPSLHRSLGALSAAQQTLVEDGWARNDDDLTKLLDEIELGTHDLFSKPIVNEPSIAGAQTKNPVEIASNWRNSSLSGRIQVCLAVIFMLQRIQHRRAELKTPPSDCDERVKEFRLSWYRQLLGVSDKLCLSVVTQIMHSERYWLDWVATKRDEKSPELQQPETVVINPVTIEADSIDKAIAERKAADELITKPSLVGALNSGSYDIATLIDNMQSIDEPDIIELYQWVLQRAAVDNPQDQSQVDLAIPPTKRKRTVEQYFAIVQDKLQKEQRGTYDFVQNDGNDNDNGDSRLSDSSDSDCFSTGEPSNRDGQPDESMDEETEDYNDDTAGPDDQLDLM